MGYGSASRKPIKVTVGASEKPVRRKQGVVAWFAFVILLISGVMFIFLRDNGTTAVTERTVVEESPEPRVKRQAPPSAETDWIETIPAEAPSKPDPVIAKESRTEDQPPPLTPEEIEAIERAKDPLYDRHHIVAKKPLLAEPVEQLMLSVFSTELGDMPPMLPAIPQIDEERMKKMVGFLSEESEDDTDEVRAAKRMINEVKAELKKYLDEGGTVDNFLSYYVNELDSAFRERNQCKEMQMKAMKTEEPAVAREYYYVINQRLADKGIKPLTLTKRQKEYLGINE